ncbi:hypothetical protein SAMN05661080_03085 [Modestobacter sp. DSM 44400]|uniref:hypothetical protein n=1 Tax=Modestobacter sp. DSM 44400 TaxID=1550230 RepID=UPI000894CFAE|nr:hypothetical protein [Modestobacter sp. DSM 44400]SDY32536.1 hypothetical protein SAMN05661080_03085 [Modestobacter sp. DSM 44400]
MASTGALHGRRGGLALAMSAIALLSACTPATPPVQVTAATAAMPATPATPWTDAAPRPATVYPDLPVAPVATGGLQVPQPPRPTRVNRVPMPMAAVGTAPSYTPPTASCGGYSSPRRIVPGTVPGAGSATVTWMADSSPAVQGYRVSAVSQVLVTGVQPAPLQQTVAQPGGCVPITLTMTGLTDGTPYVFWMEEQVLDSRTGAVRFVQVGTSEAVVIGG